MLMMPETRRNLLCYAYRRKVAKFEECLAKSDAEGGFNLNALNDVDWVAAGRGTVTPNFLPSTRCCAVGAVAIRPLPGPTPSRGVAAGKWGG